MRKRALNSISRHVLAGSISAIALQTCIAQAQPDELKTADFQIESQPLAKALLKYSEQSRRVVVVSNDLVSGKKSAAVQGELPPEEALALMLDGTGLVWTNDQNGSVALRSVSEQVEQAQDAPAPFELAQLDTPQPAPVASAKSALETDETKYQETVIVTGLRGAPRSVINSPTPIDVINNEDLARLAGGMPLRDVLTQLVPSFQSATVGSSSFGSVTRPAGLRGLSGVHVLVLVNGKRRHNSSIVDFNSGATSMGGNPVDLDLIPASAIKQIEVLRDGAAAQYGSDAIAGVINIILKDNAEGGRFTAETGQRYGKDGSGSDGETYQASVTKGFAVGNNGSLTLTLDGKKAEPTVRNSPITAKLYDNLPDGSPDPRETTANRRTYQGGLPRVSEVKAAQNLILPFDGYELYSYGTFGYREAEVGQAGRRPNSNQNILEIYPDGYTPYYTLKETDFEIVGGGRGTIGGWDADFSSVFGRNKAENGSTNSLNASLGPDSPTEFTTFTSYFDQWTNNADFTRSFAMPQDGSLQTSFGAEFRHEKYETKSGDEASYENGGYFYTDGSLAGRPAAVGAQAAIVVTPEDEADLSRNAYATYVDLAYDVTPKLLLTAAGRFESYDDSAGDVLSGKVSGRYEVTDWLALRGAASNGFRAPSLAQRGFAQSSTSVNLVNGQYIPILSKTVQVESSIGQALGANPLKPEKSVNLSAGFTLTPLANLDISVDAYRIDLDDRITRTGLLSGAGVSTILVANGFSGDQYVRYFTNAIDTQTKGIDVVATYTYDTNQYGVIRSTLGYNHNETEITRIAENPSELAGLGLTLFDRQSQGWFTEGPKSKLILGVNWTKGPYGLNLKETRYDKFNSLNNNPAFDQSYGAKWVTDLEASYGLSEDVKLSVGAYNLFDVYPDENTVSSSIGIAPWGAGPFGHYGGYYYGRVTVNF